MDQSRGRNWQWVKRWTMRSCRRMPKDTRGAAAVEFALLSPVLVAVFCGIVGYGMVMLDEMDLVSATRAGAQLALIDSSDTGAIRTAVADASGLGISTADVTATQSCECADGTSITCGLTCGDGSSNRYFMTVTATYDHTLLLIGNTVTLTGQSIIRTQ